MLRMVAKYLAKMPLQMAARWKLCETNASSTPHHFSNESDVHPGFCKTSSIAHSWWSFVMLYARTNGSESAHGGLFAAGAGVCHRFSQACPCFDHHAWFPHQGFVDFIPVCSGNWLRPVGMWRHHIPTTIHHHNNISPPQYITRTVTPLWRCGELCLCDGRGFILIIWRSGGPHCQRCCEVIF